MDSKEEDMADIVILKSSVFENVRREASYIGSKSVTSQDPAAFERIQIGVDDEPMLAMFYEESWTELGRNLRRSIKGSPSLNTSNEYKVSVVLNDDVTEHDVKALITSFIKNMMLYKWLGFTAGSDLSKTYGTSAMDNLDALRDKLGSRSLTGRTGTIPTADDYTITEAKVWDTPFEKEADNWIDSSIEIIIDE